MAIGKVNYKMGQNLEPIANAITSMGQSASKKDKPDVLANKIKAISTDATATEGNVLNGQTFYSGGSKKTGSMVNNGAVSSSLNAGGSYTIPKGYHDGSGKVTANSLASQTAATANASQILSGQTAYVNGAKVTGSMPNMTGIRNVSTSTRRSDNSLGVQVPTGYYAAGNWNDNYQIVPLESLRSVGYALQTEVDSMTNDRNNWMNVANSRPTKYTGTLVVGTKWIFDINNFPKILLNWQSTSGDCHAFIYVGKYYTSTYLMYIHFNGGSFGYGRSVALQDGASGKLYQEYESSFNGDPSFKYAQSGSTITLECYNTPSGAYPSDSTAITYTYYI